MLLQTKALTRVYGEGRTSVYALWDTSFSVRRGEFVAVMGPSGSGKSTLMSLVGLLDQPTEGTLQLAGEETQTLDPDRLSALRNREIGFVFQSYNLLPRSTTVENVELPLIYSAVRGRKRRARAQEALELVGLSHRTDHWPSELSGGEQQRVAIARAVVTNPSLILADEPTGALDSRTGESILALFQDLNRAGRTIMMVTHDDHVASHATRILRLQDGTLISDEPVKTRDALSGPRSGEPRPTLTSPAGYNAT